MTDEPTYADRWRNSINATYGDEDYGVETLAIYGELDEDEDADDAVRRILTKAAECLRDGAVHSFSGAELDIVRHMMPAHEVHQSGAKRWVLDNYGRDDDAI